MTVSPSNPIPSVILKAIGFRESSWRQFDADGDFAAEWDCTLVSGNCGYGIMQMTDCMSTGCGWFTPSRVAGEIAYNIGTGTNWLIKKWNERSTPTCRQIGENNHVRAEDWYYSVIAYNRWSNVNDPNSYNPKRPPYLEGDYQNFSYPYQERIWGHMAHPESLGGQQWWAPQRIPWVPRGIFGPNDPTYWQPPPWTPRPTFYYLPDIKANYNGWNSYITLFNPRSDLTLAADIALYNQDGTFNQWWLDPPSSNPPPIRLAPRASRTIAVADRFPGSSFNGSAVICASQDVVVVVQNRHSSMITAYDGIGPATSTAPDPGFAKVASTLHLPRIMRNYSLYGHTWNTTIYIQNAGATTANVYVYFYNQNGTSKDTDGPYTLQPNASIQLDQANDTELGGSFIGTAKITSNWPVAAIVNTVNTSNTRAMAYNAFSSGARDVYLPLSFRNWNNLNSDIPVKNIGAGTTVDMTYYEQGGAGTWYESSYIGSNALYIFYPPPGMEGRIGAAVARNSSSNLIALLDERRDEQPRRAQYMTYNGVAKTASMETSYVSYVPILYRNYSGWQSSIQVQNMESQLYNFVTAHFFNQNGGEILFVGDWVAPNRSITFYLPAIIDLGNNYVGTAVVEGHHQVSYPGQDVNRKVIAIANVQNFSWEWQGDKDWGGGYNGFNR